MSDFYTRAAATTLRLITDKGQDITLSKPDGGTFDPALGKYTSTTPGTSGTAKGVVVPLTKLADNRYLSELVEGKLRRVLVAASGAPFEPEAGDIATFDSEDWEVFGCTPVDPAGTPVLYKMEVRRK